ncbi:hypothetical protein FEF65_09460 [Mariprofundus erugo]|uniref:AFP-like domain-containing protein n=1 Tax=Mariprofundus erugo TaxID=2528639 RepID=A0A5R9GR40_9PROT|nr:N-acetylneuraminate synthase family protein [Mariprofundus erugo]TLS66737.1 hypothetical protein FEF65_09460 [Mariprofundus erugo]
MIKLIAETAWHHEGNFEFMKDLVSRICSESRSDIVKMHVTLDLDEYMSRDHAAYDTLKAWMLSVLQWEELINIVKSSGKGLMLLLNDTTAIKFAAQFTPDLVELHSVCLNVPRLQKAVNQYLSPDVPVVIGVGGSSIQEIDAAVEAFSDRRTILMFGFQNYPTKYEDVNLAKIRKLQSLYSRLEYGYADHTAWNHENNELVTLLVAANGMGYVEKHVTTVYGKERCDYSAAISIEMLNQLSEKLKLLNQLAGNGSIGLNKGEQDYSVYGPMKMAAVATKDIKQGTELTVDLFDFRRTSQSGGLSQLDALSAVGKTVEKDISASNVIMSGDLV